MAVVRITAQTYTWPREISVADDHTPGGAQPRDGGCSTMKRDKLLARATTWMNLSVVSETNGYIRFASV